jgi:hypothetical protein
VTGVRIDSERLLVERGRRGVSPAALALKDRAQEGTGREMCCRST